MSDIDLTRLDDEDLEQIVEETPIEFVDKANPYWYHRPILWIAAAIVWITGAAPSRYSQTLFRITGDPVIYIEGVENGAIRAGEVRFTRFPIIVHELTHAFQILEVGALWWALCYTVFPLPTIWTGRASIEFEAAANQIGWKNHFYDLPELDYNAKIAASADEFSSSRYLWPTLDSKEWIDAMPEQSVTRGDARHWAKTQFSKFGGYNFR